MRLSRRGRPHGVRMNMTPMIDVVFLLIIFFLTASQMSRRQDEPIPLPELRGTSDKSESDLTVNVTLDGSLRVGGSAVTPERVGEMARRAIAQKGGRPELVRITIRADRRGTSEAVNQLFTRLKDQGILQTQIAVEVPGPGGGG